MVGLAPLHPDLENVLWALSAITMTAGNLIALRQQSLKRMLAYSSIAHTGYLLMGVVAGTSAGAEAVLFYLVAYGAMNMIAFGVMIALASGPRTSEKISDYAGLSKAHPMLAAAMTISMLSLAGIPPLFGFIGKLYLFQTALAHGLVVLVVVACFNSVLSAAYYLGVVRTMYFEAPVEGNVLAKPSMLACAVVSVATVITVVVGIVPAGILGAVARVFKNVLAG